MRRERWELHQGDCREILRGLAPASCALLLTDVPYGVSNENEREIDLVGRKGMKRNFGSWDLARDLEAIRALIRDAVQTSSAVVHPQGAAYVWTSNVVLGTVNDAIAEAFRPAQTGTLIWGKTNPAPSVRKSSWTRASELCEWGSRPKHRFSFPGHRDSFSWFTGPTVHSAHRTHPTEKPVWLWQRIISATTKPGDVVLDPFAGTGSSGEAALRLGRRWIGIELDPKYAAIAARRVKEVSKRAA